jgi:hypothetical protein
MREPPKNKKEKPDIKGGTPLPSLPLPPEAHKEKPTKNETESGLAYYILFGKISMV